MTILNLDAERLKRSKPEIKRTENYYCMRCDSGEFRLHVSGDIHCAHCGARMRNLLVTMENKPA